MTNHLTGTGFAKNFLFKAILASMIGAVCLTVSSAQAPSRTSGPEWQTAAGGKMAFDTASVKLRPPGPPRPPQGSNFPLGPGDVYIPTGGLFRAANMQLLIYIQFAYKLTDNQELSLVSQLPKWRILTSKFDIEAHAQGNPTKDQMRLMMQSLLADKFRLVVHYETRQVPVFALILDQPGKLGPLLQKHPDDSPCPTIQESPTPVAPPQLHYARFPLICGGIVGMAPSVPGRFRTGARNVTMDLIASSMGNGDGVDRPVLDKTGLTGTYDFAIEFTPQIEGSTPPGAVQQRDLTGPTAV